MQKPVPIAFLLINTELGSEVQLARDLQIIENVREVYVVYGIFDIVVKVEAETAKKVKDTHVCSLYN